MTKQNAIIYARVSTEEQKKKGYSVTGQIRDCTKYAQRMGYDVVEIFADEGISAKNLNRADLQRMFRYIKKNSKDIDAVIFWKWDRLSRGEDSDNIELARLFGKYDVTPLSTIENNETTPIANLMRKITQAMNKYELDIDSERTKAGMRRKAEEGHFPAKAPIGYINLKDEDDKGYIDIDEANVQHIKNIFKYYASGMYSFESLGRKMFLEGFKNKRGEAYPPRKFEEILKNIFYIGDFKWAGKRYEGKHKPIIDKKLFYKVQSMFSQENKPVRNDKNFIYSKLIRCASCNRVLTAEIQRGGHDSGNYVYYHCGNKVFHKSIKGMSIREEDITLAVQNIISTIEIPDSVVKRLKDKIISSLDELHIVENQLVDRKNKRIKDLDHLINKSYEDKLLGRLPASFTEERFNRQCMEWQRERDLLAVEIKESGNINRSIYKNIDLLINFCNRIPELFVNATLENKRLMLRMLIDEIQYDHVNKALVVKLKPIFEALRLIKLSGINENKDEKVLTLKKPLNTEVLEYLNEQVEECVNSKVRTLKTLVVPNKKAPEGANLINGADDGIRTHVYRNHNPRP